MQELSSEYNIFALVSVVVIQALNIYAATHAALNKRDPRVAAGWCAIIALTPLAGVVLYYLFGVNSVEKKAKKIYNKNKLSEDIFNTADNLIKYLPGNFRALARLTNKTGDFPLREKNKLAILENGETAYPEMLTSIKGAKHYILLSSFIFDRDKTGLEFANTLKEVGKNGVKVRIIVDDIGARYSTPTIVGKLKGTNLVTRRFHKVFFPWSFTYAQLRTHRKLLIVDGEVAFMGGMNIRDGHLVQSAKEKRKTQDVHFKISGEVIKDLHHTFAQDWYFSSKKRLDISMIQPTLNGQALARVSSGSPRENQGQIRWSLIGSINAARKSLKIVTPYFLPDQELIFALGAASLRGVRVEIILPEKNNHALAAWASTANLWQVLETGCVIYLSSPPFDHSKFLIVDGHFCYIGSANWDARSLRLNFELNLELYDKVFAQELFKLYLKKLKKSRLLTLSELNRRSFFIRLRDALARLLTPYL